MNAGGKMPRIFDNIEKPLLPAQQENLLVAERARVGGVLPKNVERHS
jgi:hypothetical protein